MPVNAMIALSERLGRYINFVGRWGSVFIWPLVFVTMWDVIVRKLGGIQYWLITNLGSIFESTKIQEWEWHFHTVLFTLVLGYGYVNNRHVRVDLIREKLSFRKQAWIELIGCTFFLIPYCLVVGYFAFIVAYDSFQVGEGSASLVGLSNRWMIRSFLVFGLIFAGLSGVAVWLQAALVLFTPGATLLDSALNQTADEHFSTKDFLGDPNGDITGATDTTYVSVKKLPLETRSIAVSDDNGPLDFEWKPDSSIIYFRKSPEHAITVRYEHRFQLMTLVWPEQQAIRGARTRTN